MLGTIRCWTPYLIGAAVCLILSSFLKHTYCILQIVNFSFDTRNVIFINYYLMKYRKILIKYNAYISQP